MPRLTQTRRLPDTFASQKLICMPRRDWSCNLKIERKARTEMGSTHVRKGAHSGRPLSYSEDIEDQLLQWILEARDQQLPIQRKAIQRKVLGLIQPQKLQFRASEGFPEAPFAVPTADHVNWAEMLCSLVCSWWQTNSSPTVSAQESL